MNLLRFFNWKKLPLDLQSIKQNLVNHLKKEGNFIKNLNDKLAKFLVEYRQGDRPIKCYLKAVGYILKL